VSTGRKTVFAWCPICRCPVPLFEVVVHVSGILRRDVGVTVNGDATDYIAHMWSHERKEVDHG
jgi:hypothetical protein